MAEKFEKPKRFTAEWFSYVWHYYKVHMICGVFAVVLVVITIFEIANTIEYDLNVNYIATNMVGLETEERFLKASTEKIEDVTGDGEKNISMVQLNFTPEAVQDGNQSMALENRLSSMFASSDEMFFLFDEMMLLDVLSLNATEGIFVPVQEWCAEPIEESRLYQYEDTSYAVSLADSKMMKELGIDGTGLFVVVRMNYDSDNEKMNEIYQNSVRLANALVQ